MGTDIRSILRVGLTTKAATATDPILVAADIERNQPDYAGNNVKPNQTGVAWYTVEYQSTAAGTMTVILDDGTAEFELPASITTGTKLEMFKFFIKAGWTFNLSFSENTTFDLIAITEHGGAV